MDSYGLQRLADALGDLAQEMGDKEAEIAGRALAELASARTAILESVGVEAGHVDAGPVEEGHVDAGPVEEGPVEAPPVEEGPVDAGPVEEGPVEAPPVEAPPTKKKRRRKAEPSLFEAPPVEAAPVADWPCWGFVSGPVKVWHLWCSLDAKEAECSEIEREDNLIIFCAPSEPDNTCQTCKSLETCKHGLYLNGPCVPCGREDPLASPQPERTYKLRTPVEVAPVRRKRRKAQATLFAPVEAGHVEAGHVEAPPVEAGHVEAPPVEAGHVEAPPVEVGPVDACRNGHLFVGAEPCARCGESPWADPASGARP